MKRQRLFRKAPSLRKIAKKVERRAIEERRKRENARKKFHAEVKVAEAMAKKLVLEGLPEKDAKSYGFLSDSYGGLDEKETAAIWRHVRKIWNV